MLLLLTSTSDDADDATSPVALRWFDCCTCATVADSLACLPCCAACAGGDPLGEGYGGTGITISAEFQQERGHATGTVNMARATGGTAGAPVRLTGPRGHTTRHLARLPLSHLNPPVPGAAQMLWCMTLTQTRLYRTDPDSADTQFSIMLVPNHFLDNEYTVWGQVRLDATRPHSPSKLPLRPSVTLWARSSDLLLLQSPATVAVLRQPHCQHLL